MDLKVKSAERCRQCLDVKEWKKKLNMAEGETWHHVEKYIPMYSSDC